MKTKLLLIISLFFFLQLSVTAENSPLIGTWIWIDGPSDVPKMNYINDSTAILYESGGDEFTVLYKFDTTVVPHRNTYYYNELKANLSIWSISGDTLTDKGSGGDTITFPTSFGIENNYNWVASHYVKQVTTTKINIPNISNLITISPNPTTNAFVVTGIDGTASITLSDTNGRLLFTKKVTANETVSVGYLPNGIYIVTIKLKDITKKEKIVIQH